MQGIILEEPKMLPMKLRLAVTDIRADSYIYSLT